MENFELFLTGVEAHSVPPTPSQSLAAHSSHVRGESFSISVDGVHPENGEIISEEERLVGFVSKFFSYSSEKAIPEC